MWFHSSTYPNLCGPSGPVAQGLKDRCSLLSYSVDRWPFAAAVAVLLGPLERLHETQDYPRLTVGEDVKTHWHRQFYGTDGAPGIFERALRDGYSEFIREVIRPLFGESIVYQRIPTFRVHLPGNVGVGEFHRDGDYRHPQGEVNFHLPLSDARETSAIWIESRPGAADYRPMNCNVGQVAIFDGHRKKHGNLPNETGKTRVSFDFRVVPQARFQPNPETTYNTGLRFVVGEYFLACD